MGVIRRAEGCSQISKQSIAHPETYPLTVKTVYCVNIYVNVFMGVALYDHVIYRAQLYIKEITYGNKADTGSPYPIFDHH